MTTQRRKGVFIVGATGTIGRNTLAVIRSCPDQFYVAGVSGYNNVRALARIVCATRPRYAAVAAEHVDTLKHLCAGTKGTRFVPYDAVGDCFDDAAVDIVVIGVTGVAALPVFRAALRYKKRIAPANKEALVTAGDLLMRQARASGTEVVPIDSEQSGVFQCLQGESAAFVERVTLTASGGPLWRCRRRDFHRLTRKEILRHPRWRMGAKITVDSATMMNKGLEMIEAKVLFDLRPEQIDVVIHPQAVVHALVTFCDGSVKAQLSPTDMRYPIQYALSFPERCEGGPMRLCLWRLKQLTFEKPDAKRFPLLSLAHDVLKRGGDLPAVMNAANETAVAAFLRGRLRFLDIERAVNDIVGRHRVHPSPGWDDLMAADAEARRLTEEWIQRHQAGRRVIGSIGS